jgi:transcriptional regulator with XRE-family HTH domain
MSQEALAQAASLHRNYIGMLERGERSPTLLVVQRLAVALGTTMVSLIQEYEADA